MRFDVRPQDPIKLFWWKAVPNFGDQLSAKVVEFVSGRKVVWSKESDADLFAVGSILRHVENGITRRSSGQTKPWIWGTGSMVPGQNVTWLKETQIAAVRGSRTATIFGLPDLPLGDPGILISDAMPRSRDVKYRLGVVPHLNMVKELSELAEIRGNSDVLLINPSAGLDEVVDQIASCSMIISSSLHGLIVADSYGIPNHWIKPVGTHHAPRFKFWDYGSSVDRVLKRPLQGESLRDFIRSPYLPPIAYTEGIEASKKALMSSFPIELMNPSKRNIG